MEATGLDRWITPVKDRDVLPHLVSLASVLRRMAEGQFGFFSYMFWRLKGGCTWKHLIESGWYHPAAGEELPRGMTDDCIVACIPCFFPGSAGRYAGEQIGVRFRHLTEWGILKTLSAKDGATEQSRYRFGKDMVIALLLYGYYRSLSLNVLEGKWVMTDTVDRKEGRLLLGVADGHLRFRRMLRRTPDSNAGSIILRVEPIRA